MGVFFGAMLVGLVGLIMFLIPLAIYYGLVPFIIMYVLAFLGYDVSFLLVLGIVFLFYVLVSVVKSV